MKILVKEKESLASYSFFIKPSNKDIKKTAHQKL